MLRSAPADYERALGKVAHEAGVEIRQRSDMGSFFREYPYAGGAHSPELSAVGVDIDRSNRESYEKGLGTLEHELIHALQEKYSPNMPIELMEYEAYVAGGNNEELKEFPEDTEAVLFQMLIGGSVRHWYTEMSKKRGIEVKPEWDDPDFFLRQKSKA